MASRNVIAIDIGRRRLQAVCAQRTGRRGANVEVTRTLQQPLPDDLDSTDAEALGRWVKTQLKAARFPRGRATIAIAREHVGVKRLTLPTSEEDELPQMTRLTMQRDLPFDAEQAVIDFVPVKHTETNTTVVAVAAPNTVLQSTQQAARRAGLSVGRIALRSFGSSALLNTLDGEKRDNVLSIDITDDAVEFCVLLDGAVRFSRAAELPDTDDVSVIADAVTTEARRTWMSYRIGDDSMDVSRAIVMGDREIAERVVTPVQEMLHVPTERLTAHPRVQTHGEQLGGLWPLAGLLLEPSLENQSIDFLHPTQPPDPAARRRATALAAAGLVMLLAVGGWMYAKRDLQRLEQKADQLSQRVSDLGPDYVRYYRDAYKLQHVRYWDSVQVDWIDHLAHITEMSPPPGRIVLDSCRASLRFDGVQYDRRSRENPWSAPMAITIVVDGEARDRETADAFREALVDAELYNASSTGADAPGGRRLPFGFTYRLRTTNGDPVPDDDDAAVADEQSADSSAGNRQADRKRSEQSSEQHKRAQSESADQEATG